MLRPAVPQDLPDLSALCLRSKAHWGYDAEFIAACREELTLTEADLADPVIVAEIGGQVAGLAQVGRKGADADLLLLYVEPAAMGYGVGRALFDWCLKTALTMAAPQLLIEADPHAASFYEKMGATRIGEAPSGSIPGRVLPLLTCPVR